MSLIAHISQQNRGVTSARDWRVAVSILLVLTAFGTSFEVASVLCLRPCQCEASDSILTRQFIFIIVSCKKPNVPNRLTRHQHITRAEAVPLHRLKFFFSSFRNILISAQWQCQQVDISLGFASLCRQKYILKILLNLSVNPVILGRVGPLSAEVSTSS